MYLEASERAYLLMMASLYDFLIRGSLKKSANEYFGQFTELWKQVEDNASGIWKGFVTLCAALKHTKKIRRLNLSFEIPHLSSCIC